MFTDLQMANLQALINCIIPADDFPNGWDVGVGDYLFKQFEGDLKDKMTIYQKGLSSLEDESQTVYADSFASLSSEQQTALLTQIEAGQIKSDWQTNPIEFFTMVVEHTTEGYYSNPENGGNRDQIAWQMIGFEVRG